MTTFLQHTQQKKNRGPGRSLLLLFFLFAAPVIAQEAQIDPQIISNGGEFQEGGFGEMFSTIGEPLASDSMAVNLVDDQSTWIGFWNVVPSDTTSGVYEEWASGGAGQNGITVAAPNPFSEELQVYVRLEKPSNVRLIVYDMLGREAQALIDGEREAGTTRVRWQPEGLTPGTYILRLEVDGTELPARTVQYVK